MTVEDAPSRPPLISVLVPARNEEASLKRCLASLSMQTGVELEIIVVDDHSTDRTHEIAESFPGVRVITPSPLPKDWTGKNNALVTGAMVAQGEWLLFTDADTFHLPGSLARALDEAQRSGVAMLSYSPQQEVHGLWQRAVMPVIFAELACTYSPSRVNDPEDAAAAANGQYILVKRDVYNCVGGHASVATSLLEDVALATRVKKSGHRILFSYGADAVQTRMYRSFAQLREGWTKNLALLFPACRHLASIRLLEFTVLAGCASLTAYGAMRGTIYGTTAAALVFTAAWVHFLTRIRRAHFSYDSNFLAVLGLPMFSYLLLCSASAHSRGSVAWKGRTYSSNLRNSATRSVTGNPEASYVQQ